jgi:hypothetical protein
VDLYGRANGKAAQLVSLLEKCVHASGVHQGNEGNEEFWVVCDRAVDRLRGLGWEAAQGRVGMDNA